MDYNKWGGWQIIDGPVCQNRWGIVNSSSIFFLITSQRLISVRIGSLKAGVFEYYW